MKITTFIAATVMLASSGANICIASTVQQTNDPTTNSKPISNTTYVSDVETDSLEKGSTLSVPVPEPAAFGFISLALAVGGGLMIRRKTD